ncbi:MAG: FprA family A-type flavoprotein, partial [Bacteroidales bacterium]|nr:FprA family A-type flavoprotein [Candidatus Colimorpha merdihippi]
LHAALQANEPLAKAYYRYEAENEGVLVAYASIHGGTAEAANLIGEKLRQMGCPKVGVSDLSRDDIAEVIEDAFRYPRPVCCAASYDANVFPPMHDFLWHLQIKNYQNRRIALLENGSWAPCAGKAMKALIEPMKNITLIDPVVTIRSRMKQTDVPAIEQLCRDILA